MTTGPPVSAVDLEALRRLDTCTVSDAVETFEVRLRNTGFTDARIHCMFEDFPPMVGYAATARMRSGEPPIAGRVYHERGDWWHSILNVPAPRIVVLEDVDAPPGRGAFLGDMHTAILQALGCVGYVTNGAVRELPRIREFGFNVFAGSLAVSHAYSHIFDFGHSVQIGGLEISPGSLLHGDRHGVLRIPSEIATQIPDVAAQLQKNQKTVIDFCRSKEFTVGKLSQLMNKQF
ncbi:MAG TPA: RraA family protein [Terriglobales bacterium]|nr:RraA family protein [Terriglobales bacterium]